MLNNNWNEIDSYRFIKRVSEDTFKGLGVYCSTDTTKYIAYYYEIDLVDIPLNFVNRHIKIQGFKNLKSFKNYHKDNYKLILVDSIMSDLDPSYYTEFKSKEDLDNWVNTILSKS